MRELLGNLHEMHGRVETVFTHLRLPPFRVEDADDSVYRLFYASEQAGLVPMPTCRCPVAWSRWPGNAS